MSLHSQSNIEAENSVDRLCDIVEKLVEGNGMLSRRLAAYEVDSTVPEPRTFTTEAPDANEIHRSVKGFAFEELLMNSRAYRKMASDGDDGFSILSSAGRTASWSMLSGLSLSEMSNIAVLALPVYAGDIRNAESYDFEVATREPSVAVEPSKQSPQSGKGRSWWRRFKSADLPEGAPVFGIALGVSVRYANVAISLMNDKGETFIYGWIPILVAKCGVHLKEHG